jgi:CxxC motif-containing protein
MIEKEICCVVCPIGCSITVRAEGEDIKEIINYTCKRGETYARNEFISPVRVLTGTVKAESYCAPVISVRTSVPIPKGKLLECMELLRDITATPPFEIGKVVVEDILGTGADLILTNN